MNTPTTPAPGGYKHATRFTQSNVVYHQLGGKGIVTGFCIRGMATTYEVTWADKSSTWCMEAELSAVPVCGEIEAPPPESEQ